MDNSDEWINWAKSQPWPVECSRCDDLKQKFPHVNIWTQHFLYHVDCPQMQPVAGDDELRRHFRRFLKIGLNPLFDIWEVEQGDRDKLFDAIVEANMIVARDAAAQAAKHAKAEGEEKAICTIYGIANDLANKDPEAIGSVPLAPYFASAIAIYQEYLKGDNYERIDWKSLDLPTARGFAEKQSN